MKFDFTQNVELFEEAKRIIFTEAMSSGTLGELDVDSPALTYSLIPYLIWSEISLGANREARLMKAVHEVDISGQEGNIVRIAVLDRDEYTAQSISEDTLDNSGYTKTKMSPDSVSISIGDIVYVATRISDVLQEDSHLGWVRAMLQKMGSAIAKKMDSDVETHLYSNAGTTNLVACTGTLTHAKVVEAKRKLKDNGWLNEEVILFVNPTSEEALLTESGASYPMTLERVQIGDLDGYRYADTVIVVSDTVRSKFAYAMVDPTEFQKASVVFAWKRKPKMERDRDSQYGRDKYFLTTRYGYGTKQTTSMVLISNC